MYYYKWCVCVCYCVFGEWYIVIFPVMILLSFSRLFDCPDLSQVTPLVTKSIDKDKESLVR